MERQGYKPPEEGDDKDIPDSVLWERQFGKERPLPEGVYFDKERKCWIIPTDPGEGELYSHC